MNPWEVAGVLFGIVSVALIVRENVWGWPTGLVNVLLFVVVFWQVRLYADMGLQVVYAALCLYGWWAWLRGGRESGKLEVGRTPRRLLAAFGLAGVIFAVLLGAVLQRQTDAALPFWDASTSSFSLVAQAMQARKWLENWWVWIAVDIVYVGMYVAKHLYLTALLYAVFLGLAVVGAVRWRRSLLEAAKET